MEEVEENPIFDGEKAALLVKELRRSFDSGKTRSYKWRISRLEAVAKMLEEREKDIITALDKDLFKPGFEAFISEVSQAKSSCSEALKELHHWMEPEKVTARRIIAGKWACNNEQACISVDYIITKKEFAPTLMNALKEELEQTYGKDPMESRHMSRIMSPSHFARIVKLLDVDKVFGKIVLGGQKDEKQLKIALQPSYWMLRMILW